MSKVLGEERLGERLHCERAHLLVEVGVHNVLSQNLDCTSAVHSKQALLGAPLLENATLSTLMSNLLRNLLSNLLSNPLSSTLMSIPLGNLLSNVLGNLLSDCAWCKY